MSSSFVTAAPPQRDLFGSVDVPVIAAWGAGVDSTAMLIELLARRERVDAVLFADTGDEKAETYKFIDLFKPWLEARGVPVHIVRYQPKNFKNWPEYDSLFGNLLSNGTLPGIAFGRGTCSIKWKQAPQHTWMKNYPPARACWAAGGKVVKLIGYDASPADTRRFANAPKSDQFYDNRYPLREWGWSREDCIARIKAAGLPVPVKSACWFCTAQKPNELDNHPKDILRRIVLIEARAAPRLRNVDGLWRKPVKGMRGATPRPGSMTEYIRAKNLLPSEEVDFIISQVPSELIAWREAMSGSTDQPTVRQWTTVFDAAVGRPFSPPTSRAA